MHRTWPIRAEPSPLWRWVAALPLALVFLAVLTAAPAFATKSKYAAIVVDVETGRVLHARSADHLRYPASLTKIMTLYVTFDELRAGRLKLRDRVPFSRRAARQPPSKLGLRVGKSISVKQAILALVTKSANDVATALAERISGSESAFAKRMTRTARRLGMSRTTFRNASGLPHSGQRSTARDMSRLGLAMLRNHPRRYRYFSERSFKFKGRKYINHNKLLANYKGTDGIKTGFIQASGFNLVASAKRRGRRLIGVVFGGRTGARRDQQMRRLLDQGFARAAKTLPPPLRFGPPIPTRKPIRSARIVTPGQKSVRSPSRPIVHGRWVVQVGAYNDFHQARRQALRAGDAIEDLLRRQGGAVNAVVDGKHIYRARLVGLRREHAQRACRALKSQRIDCLALPPSRSATSVRRPVS